MHRIETMTTLEAVVYERIDDFRYRTLSIVLPVPFAVARTGHAEALAASGDPHAK